MLRAATPAHSGFIRQLLREGAADGSFETDIALDSAAASLFFATLDEALASGYLRTPGPDGRLTRETHIAGYVYCPREVDPPVGFGLFKDLGADGFELWLTGIALEARGRGHGRAMLAELFATPPGRLVSIVRCNRKSATCEVAARLFGEFGFTLCRTTPAMLWLANTNASPDLLQRIAALPAAA